MAKRKDTFWYDMARNGVLKCLVGMSQDGLTPQVKVGEFPTFHVYPSKRPDLGELACDLPCKLGQTMEEKQASAQELVNRLGKVWAVNPFAEVTPVEPGILYFKIPEAATHR